LIMLPKQDVSQQREALNPEWHESLYAVELALLLGSPVYYAAGVPAGDGSAVILVPGFLHGDTYLIVMYAWLKRLGYSPYYSGIGFNASCPNLLISEILDPVITEAAKKTGRKVHLVGHSLGGVIARSVATRRSDIASVITLASPVRQTAVRKRIFQNAEVVRQYLIAHHAERVQPQCLTVECSCDFMKSMRQPLPSKVPLTAIYTRNDGLVEWRSCRTGDPAVDVEVPGTHTGMAFNPSVYRVIAQRLASASTERRVRGAIA
jgi:pimeloyl-ACP methyl ester carboxylesterase